MGNKTMVITTCDVPGCKNRVEVEGNDVGIPVNWDMVNNYLLCPDHIAAVKAVLSGKGKVNKTRGPDRKPRNKGKGTLQAASGPPVVEVTNPEPTRAKLTKKQKADRIMDLVRETNDAHKNKESIEYLVQTGDYTPERAVQIRTDQGQYCVGCKDKTCILTGTEALTCWINKNPPMPFDKTQEVKA